MDTAWDTGGVWYTVESTGGLMYASTCDTPGSIPTSISIHQYGVRRDTSNPSDPVSTDGGDISMGAGTGEQNSPVQIHEDSVGPAIDNIDATAGGNTASVVGVGDRRRRLSAFDCENLMGCLPLESDDRASCGSHHRVVWNATASTTYYIMVKSLGTEFDLEVGTML
mmetsp:Transcript_22710/g.63382  ORF Transcript_22710/g.63382 Transcript_22710/m.63382 type:complete len:167 (-) Transcript_22710:705-1205(-)